MPRKISAISILNAQKIHERVDALRTHIIICILALKSKNDAENFIPKGMRPVLCDLVKYTFALILHK